MYSYQEMMLCRAAALFALQGKCLDSMCIADNTTGGYFAMPARQQQNCVSLATQTLQGYEATCEDEPPKLAMHNQYAQQEPAKPEQVV